MCTYGNTAHDPIRQIHYKSTSVLVPVPATRFTSVLETRPETSNVNQTCEKGNFVQFAVVMNWHHVVRAPYILLSFFGVKMFSMSAHHIKAHTVYHLSSLRFRIRANKIANWISMPNQIQKFCEMWKMRITHKYIQQQNRLMLLGNAYYPFIYKSAAYYRIALIIRRTQHKGQFTQKCCILWIYVHWVVV